MAHESVQCQDAVCLKAINADVLSIHFARLGNLIRLHSIDPLLIVIVQKNQVLALKLMQCVEEVYLCAMQRYAPRW